MYKDDIIVLVYILPSSGLTIVNHIKPFEN